MKRSEFLFSLMVVLLIAAYIETPSAWGLAQYSESTGTHYIAERRALDTISLKPITGVVVVVVLMSELMQLLVDRIPFRINALQGTIGVYLAWRLFSYWLYSYDTEGWRIEIWFDQLIAFLAFVTTLLHFRYRSPDRTLRLVVSIATVGSLVAIAQLAYGLSLGFDYFDYRPSGLFADAVSLSLILFAAVTLADEGYAPVKRKWSIARSALLWAGMVASGSGGVWVVAAFDILIMRPLRRKRRGARGRAPLAALAPALGALALIVMGAIFLNSSELMKDIDPRRGERWRLTSQIFMENPLFGIGTGQYEPRQLEMNPYRAFGSNPHNFYLQVMVENGVLGFLVFVVPMVILGALAVSRRLRDEGPSPARTVVALSLGAGYIGFLSSIPLEYLMILMLITVSRRSSSYRLPIREPARRWYKASSAY